MNEYRLDNDYVDIDHTLSENIIVALNNEEFNNLEKIIYDKYAINKNNCNICLDIFQEKEELIKLKCTHLYHINCIAEWLKKHSNKCPICRDEIAKGTPINL